MPNYDYLCETCGPFTASRPMARYQEPHDCPACGASAPRAILHCPNAAGISAAAEPAAAPSLGGHMHGAGCGCGH